MKKIIVALSLVIAMVLSTICFAIPASAEVYSGTAGSNLTWTFDREIGELIISGEGEMTDYPWRSQYRNEIKRVVVGEGVTSVCFWAFMSCENLENISLPNTLTKIAPQAFSACKKLTTINIPNSVIEIGYGAFGECYALTSVTLPAGLTKLNSSLFYQCKNLKNINIPASVTIIDDSAFSGCVALPNVTFPVGLTELGDGAFSSCHAFTNIIIPEGVISIGTYAFSSCFNVKSISLPTSLQSIGDYAFSSAESLKAITIPGRVSAIGQSAFQKCDDMTSVTILDGVREIKKDAFYDCDALTTITIPASVTSIGQEAFSSCDNLISIYLPDGVQIGEDAFNECPKLKEVYYYCGTQTEWDSIKSAFSEDVTVYFHRFDYAGGEVVTLPTHTERGTKKVFCIDCGEEGTWFIDTTPEHTMGEGQPYSKSKHKKVCECGYEVYEDHDWDFVKILKEGTHDNYGQALHVCADCGDTYISYTTKYDCSFGVKPWEPHDENQHKQGCYCPLVRYADHTWDSGKITTAPTADEDGVKTYTCNVCGGTKTEVIQKLSGGANDEEINADSSTEATTEVAVTSTDVGGGCSSFVYSGVAVVGTVTLIGTAFITKRKKIKIK